MSFLFYIKNKIAFKGLPYQERSSPFFLPPTERGNNLFHKYCFSNYANSFNETTVSESLGVLDLLDVLPLHYFSSLPQQFLSIDIGAKNWKYLPGIALWLERAVGNKKLEMFGIEIDAFRLYADFRTRWSYANYYASKLSGQNRSFVYKAADFRGCNLKAELITCFFPFVFENPHRAWGLPRSLFSPSKFFDHLQSCLLPGGLFIMANQGEWEWKESLKFVSELKLLHIEEMEGSLHPCTHKIFLTLWTRVA